VKKKSRGNHLTEGQLKKATEMEEGRMIVDIKSITNLAT